jgi:hypothetical protein
MSDTSMAAKANFVTRLTGLRPGKLRRYNPIVAIITGTKKAPKPNP